MDKLSNPQKTIEVIQKHGFDFQKKFGQNFLIDPHVLDKIIAAAEITKDDFVLEIGPGIGTMTQALAEAAREVTAVEIDRKLIPILHETLADYDNITILNQDVLKTDIAAIAREKNGGQPIKVVANLPYYITTPIIMGLFESQVPVDSITVMVQKEVAQRMQAYPGANDFFDSPARSDGSQKWVDFVHTYWHVDCVRSKSLAAFTEHYQNWCRRRGYNFSADKAERIYQASSDLIAVFPKDDSTKLLIRQAVAMLNTASETVETLRRKMDETASTLPEYPVVMAMNGVGPTLGPQLMAEIGDVMRFTHREALTAFAGVDPRKSKDSGQHIQKSAPTTKKGSPNLRKTLFQIMDGLIKRSPADDPVYAFMDKKRSEGKPYYVYMTAGANKFLRIYYGRVREYLASLPETEEN